MNLAIRCFMSLLLLLSSFCAAQQVQIKRVPITYVSASSGEKMYATYCASCHGKDGKGTGPAAQALSTPPADLTHLARYHGRFTQARIYTTILGDSGSPAHDSLGMPLWGDLFSSISGGSPMARVEAQHRAFVLTNYVSSLQQ